MKNILEYKEYLTKIEFSATDGVLFGKIEGITDLITFESDSACRIEGEFHNAVDDYLAFCKEVGKEPDKLYKGSFNVRINQELHKRLAVQSIKNGDSLNQSVEKAIKMYLNGPSIKYIEVKESCDTTLPSAFYLQTEKMWNNKATASTFSSSSKVISIARKKNMEEM
ncbi:MAG: type II toxin-antitoxin system HicB family antitoxin [Lachnospiraceae bacterium]|nr:type II toxin-antitoxin system HicB family antitoxin [Lachnospiraceae bacterium]